MSDPKPNPDRAAVYREAADVAERLMDERYGPDCSYGVGGRDVARELRRLADSEDGDQQADGPTWSDTCPHCKRWYTTSEPGAHEAACPRGTM